MTTQPCLSGVLTALVTPMNRDGSLDLVALDDLVDAQLAAGITGLVPCGTTGEAGAHSLDERNQVISRVVQRVGNRIPVIAGTGNNSTAETILLQRAAKDLGVSHGLVVTPYYNKPTPEGLYRHYATIAEAVDLPIVAYNVPGRTGCDLRPETFLRLASIPQVVAIKEATGDLLRLTPLLSSNKPTLSLLSGDDATACPFVLLGGHGVISVASNVIPKEMTTLIRAAQTGNLNEARKLHHDWHKLISVLFIESNPIPIKAALAMQKRLGEHYRLPLCEMQPNHREILRTSLIEYGLL